MTTRRTFLSSLLGAFFAVSIARQLGAQRPFPPTVVDVDWSRLSVIYDLDPLRFAWDPERGEFAMQQKYELIDGVTHVNPNWRNATHRCDIYWDAETTEAFPLIVPIDTPNL